LIRKSYLVLAFLLSGIAVAVMLISPAGTVETSLENSLENKSELTGEITMNGNIKLFISDCAPSPQPTGCIMHKFYLFENINGTSYTISNPNFTSINLKGKNLEITGNLITPSTVELSFIKGDLEVTNFSILDENKAGISP